MVDTRAGKYFFYFSVPAVGKILVFMYRGPGKIAAVHGEKKRAESLQPCEKYY